MAKRNTVDGITLCPPDKEPVPDGYNYKPRNATDPGVKLLLRELQRREGVAQRLATNAANVALRRRSLGR